jgi:hypothetical protein
MANIAGVRRIKIMGKVIMPIGITFAVLTWILLYGTTGGSADSSCFWARSATP